MTKVGPKTLKSIRSLPKPSESKAQEFVDGLLKERIAHLSKKRIKSLKIIAEGWLGNFSHIGDSIANRMALGILDLIEEVEKNNGS